MNPSSQPSPASRRDFLRRTTLAFSSTAIASVPASRTSAAVSSDGANEVIYMSATKLAGLIRAKKVSAAEAVEAYIARQIEVNDRLNAVVMNCYSRARAEAKKADAAAARGEWMGALHGVPMTLKDSLDTEGVISTGATFGRQQYVPEKDATVVARLRAAGAILLGKTNTPEFTLGGLPGINTASNLLYGASHNPYDLTRSTSGSSGGAGAIVAAGGAAFDIGSDWGGSIRGPSHNNGIAGIKPTSVRVPRTGHIVGYGGALDLWQQLGPMARRVEDLSLITPIISGPDFQDAACAPVPWADPQQVDVSKLRLAYFKSNGLHDPDTDTQQVVSQVVAALKSSMASVTEDAPTAVLKDLSDARGRLTNGDGWAFYQRLVEKWGTNNPSPRVKARYESLEPLSSAAYVQAWEDADNAKSRLLRWFKDYDVLICPVALTPADPIDKSGPAFQPGSWFYMGAFNCTGWPGVVVRSGTSTDGNELPIGVQVIANPWREDICLAVASAIERNTGGWQRPPL